VGQTPGPARSRQTVGDGMAESEPGDLRETGLSLAPSRYRARTAFSEKIWAGPIPCVSAIATASMVLFSQWVPEILEVT